MILDTTEWDNFEKQYKKNEKMSLKKKFKIINALYREAVKLKVFNTKNKLEGLDVKIRIARAVNSV